MIVGPASERTVTAQPVEARQPSTGGESHFDGASDTFEVGVPTRYRVVQYGQNSFAVQKKGWFFWRNPIESLSCGVHHSVYFKTFDEAKQWIDAEALKDRMLAEARAFKKKVVWP